MRRLATTEVILMAGGFGTRLRPLTETCPKAMLQLGGKPLLERTIERLREQGFRRFQISINYLGHLIEAYFGSGAHLGVEISYVREDKQLGTGGALAMLQTVPDAPLLVLNADLLTDVDCRVLLDAHRTSGAVATMCVRDHHTSIPFGIVEADGDVYKGTREKPTLVHTINAGIYCLDPETLQHIPRDTFFNMPSLFDTLIDDGKTCAVHRVRNLWFDIGSLEDFDRAQRMFDARDASPKSQT